MTKDELRRDKYYRKTYGISLRDYNRMLLLQGKKCAICQKPATAFKNRLAIDHNHKTGKVRGLLCFYCNKRMVGRNTIETAEKILNYLLKYDVRAE